MPTILDDYRYDPLDRLVGTRDVLRFYNAKYIATEVEGDVTRCFFTHETQPLAQLQQQAGVTETRLLATDRQHSVVHTLTATEGYSREYSPYGFQPASREQGDELGFNGERRAPVTGHYLLGQGYRAYNPVLMRFNSPDTLSPFNKGGINSYAYCLRDPINLIDTDGHSAASLIATIFRNIPAFDQVPRLNIVHHAAANAAPVLEPLGRVRFALRGNNSMALVPADRASVVTVPTSRAAAAIEAPIAIARASTSRSAQGAAAAPAPIASTSRAASAVAAQNTSSAADFFHARQASRTRQAAAARSAPAPAPQPSPEADTQEAARWIRGDADLW